MNRILLALLFFAAGQATAQTALTSPRNLSSGGTLSSQVNIGGTLTSVLSSDGTGSLSLGVNQTGAHGSISYGSMSIQDRQWVQTTEATPSVGAAIHYYTQTFTSLTTSPVALFGSIALGAGVNQVHISDGSSDCIFSYSVDIYPGHYWVFSSPYGSSCATASLSGGSGNVNATYTIQPTSGTTFTLVCFAGNAQCTLQTNSGTANSSYIRVMSTLL